MGKTSLLRRLAVEVDHDPELSKRFVALRFREEQYNVLNLASFWRNCMESLAEWAEKSGLDDLADRLDEIASGNHCQDDDTAEECFEAEMVALGRRAVLLVDNLDLVLSALPEKSNWKLRGVLQSKAGPIVVGAASQALKATANRDAAFYEFFQPHYLNPLDLTETRDCMLTLAKRRDLKGKAVQLVVRSQPERLQTLHALTGGNPRVISLIYRLLESSDTHEVMSDLNALLDDVTPYYKHKIEEYSSTQQRAVIDAISLNWDPITTGDLSKITGIKSTTISPILVKLRKDGMIENVDVSGSYAGHQIVERFFNIWYLMRHGTRRTKQKMRWLVGFFTSFYSPKELMQLSSKFDSKKGVDVSVHPEYASALREALACEGHFVDGSHRQTLVNDWAEGEADVNSTGRFERSDEISIPDLFRPVWEAEKTGLNKRVLSEIYKLPHALEELEKIADKEYVGRLFNIKGNALSGLKDYQAALRVYDALVARYGDDEADNVRERAAAAMLNKGVALAKNGDLEAALATYDALIERYGDDEADGVRERAARAMRRKGLALKEGGDLEAALTAYDALIALYGDDDAGNVREVAASAMLNNGLVLDESGDLEAALTAYDALIERYGDDEADDVRTRVAMAMHFKGHAFENRDLEAALTAYDALIERYGDDEADSVRTQVARAMRCKGLALKESGDLEAALTAYDALIARYGDDDAGNVREVAARAMFSKGLALDESGDLEAALTAYDALIARYGDDEADDVRAVAARAMLSKGFALDKSGDLEAALMAYDALIERYGDDEADDVREFAAVAMLNKGVALDKNGDLEAALTAYDALIERYGDDEADDVREFAAVAMFSKGFALDKNGDLEAALATYDALIARYGDDEADGVREAVARAMLNKGHALDKNGDLEAALTAYDALIKRYGDDEADGVREFAARAMLNKGHALDKNGDLEAALTTYDALIERYGDDEADDVREFAARAMFNKGHALAKNGDLEAALATYDALIERYGDDEADGVREAAVDALINLANGLIQGGLEFERAERLLREAMPQNSLLARANLVWLQLLTGDEQLAKDMFQELDELPPFGKALMSAAFELRRDNFGSAMKLFEDVVGGELDKGDWNFEDDIERFLLIAKQKGFGERLVSWFEETRLSEKVAPLFVAIKGFVGGEELLNDANPEVRGLASQIYERLATFERNFKKK